MTASVRAEIGSTASPRINPGRLARALLPALSLALVLGAIAYLNPRAISYFGFTLMLNLAIPITLATIAQMFVIAGNDLDLSIGRCHVHAFYLSTPLRAQRSQGGKSSS